ncbi:hypothetical protein BVRB_020400, partial [Beta vulgaris subsp. vulgaris]
IGPVYLMSAENREHPLKARYSLWIAPRSFAGAYQAQLTHLATFSTVESFWRHWSWTIRPSEIGFNCDLHLFRDRIRPIWEDDNNVNGGKWEIHLRKGIASRCFEDVILAVLGDQFRVGDEICGVVVSIKSHEDMLSIWNRSAHDQDVISSIRDTLKQILNIPSNQALQYHVHSEKMAAMQQQQ